MRLYKPRQTDSCFLLIFLTRSPFSLPFHVMVPCRRSYVSCQLHAPCTFACDFVPARFVFPSLLVIMYSCFSSTGRARATFDFLCVPFSNTGLPKKTHAAGTLHTHVHVHTLQRREEDETVFARVGENYKDTPEGIEERFKSMLAKNQRKAAASAAAASESPPKRMVQLKTPEVKLPHSSKGRVSFGSTSSPSKGNWVSQRAYAQNKCSFQSC